MTAVTDRVLRELAIGDIVAIVRRSLDRNRHGDGTPSPAYSELATALARLDRLGGLEALTLDLWRCELSDCRWAAAPAGPGADRPPASAGAPLRQQARRSAPAGSGAGAAAVTRRRRTGA